MSKLMQNNVFHKRYRCTYQIVVEGDYLITRLTASPTGRHFTEAKGRKHRAVFLKMRIVFPTDFFDGLTTVSVEPFGYKLLAGGVVRAPDTQDIFVVCNTLFSLLDNKSYYLPEK